MILHLICDGETKHVDGLKSGDRGICPHCKTAKMYVKQSITGKKFASLMPGQVHTRENCRIQEQHVVSYEPSISSDDFLFSSILRPSVKREIKSDENGQAKQTAVSEITGTEDFGIESSPDASLVNPNREDAPKGSKKNRRKLIRQDRKITSLKMLWKSFAHDLSYDYPFGRKKLGDVVIFPKFAERFFASNTGEGQHVFYCRFLGCMDSALTLIFVLFWKDGEKHKSQYLILRCEPQDEELYDEVYPKFQEYYEDQATHGIRWRAKENQPDVMIGGVFERIQAPACRKYCFLNCKKCRTKSVLLSKLNNIDQQIFACPGTGKKEKSGKR